jgi:hypothetical protein
MVRNGTPKPNNIVTGSNLTRLPEIFLAHFLEIAEADVRRLALHLIEDFSGIGPI